MQRPPPPAPPTHPPHTPIVPAVTRDELITTALRALATCIEADKDLDGSNTVVGIVGPDEAFHLLEGDAVAPFLVALAGVPRPAAGTAGAEAAESAMDLEADGRRPTAIAGDVPAQSGAGPDIEFT